MLSGQDAKDTAAPIPAQILAAKTVFISNAGGDGPVWLAGGPNRAYNQFYAAMKSWARYEIVSSPAAADLVLEISYAKPVAYDGKFAVHDPQFHLTILDPKTRVMLWSLTEHFEYSSYPQKLGKRFDEALDRLMEDLKKLTDQPAAASEKK
jgi:hypothetical protein